MRSSLTHRSYRELFEMVFNWTTLYMATSWKISTAFCESNRFPGNDFKIVVEVQTNQIIKYDEIFTGNRSCEWQFFQMAVMNGQSRIRVVKFGKTFCRFLGKIYIKMDTNQVRDSTDSICTLMCGHLFELKASESAA